MRTFGSMEQMGRALAAHFGQMQVEALELPEELAIIAAPILGAEIRAMYGQNPPLADLADVTQAQREKDGYTPNDPLLRSGELRDAESVEAVGPIAAGGNSSEIGKYLEHGFVNARSGASVPPRPVHLYGLIASEPLVVQAMKRAANRILR